MLRVGDYVIISKDLKECDVSFGVNYPMLSYAGKLAKIDKIDYEIWIAEKVYFLNLDNHYFKWSRKFFSHICESGTNKLIKNDEELDWSIVYED